MSADHPIPEIVLERYRLRELPANDAVGVAARAGRDPRLRERLDALDRSDAEFAAGALARRLEDGVRRRLADDAAAGGAAATPGLGRRAQWALAATAAAVLLFLVILPRGAARPDVGGVAPAAVDSGDRLKGLRPGLALYRRTADGSETLADGAVARNGDLLRIGYRAAGRPYGVILSVDGRGSVTVHLPDAAARAAALRRDATVLLDRAYELDDAPKWERFFFITGSEPFAVAPVVDAARRAAAGGRGAPPLALPLPSGFEQSGFSIQKESRP